jgi:DNA-binding CsgD family transcriptional regulator
MFQVQTSSSAMPRLRPLLRSFPLRDIALGKLRELRRMGYTYREIAARFAPPREQRGRLRFPPECLLVPPPAASDADLWRDRIAFIRGLDEIDQGMAFFTCAGRPILVNRAFRKLVERDGGRQLAAEVDLFADSVSRIVALRCLETHQTVEDLSGLNVPYAGEPLNIRGTYLGLDLFGETGTILITVERPRSEPLSQDVLRQRFGLTRQESRITRLLAEGCSNAEIAQRLSISPHTARHHTERILRKLGIHSRAEVGARVLRG